MGLRYVKIDVDKNLTIRKGNMIYTSCYKEWKSDKFTTYSISRDCGKDAGYSGKCYLGLAPNASFWKVWRNNIGKISEEENNKYYVQEYWKEVLSKLDPEEVYNELDNSVLLCYEPNYEFCHRHIVAAWFKLFLGIDILEKKSNDNEVIEVDKPEYIEKYLEDAIRSSKDMKGFNSIKALYLFEKSEKLEALANEQEQKTGESSIYLRQKASLLRCCAKKEEKNNTLNNNVIKKVLR